MSIIVENIKIHETPIVNEVYPSGISMGIKSYREIPVIEGKLIILDGKTQYGLNESNYGIFVPILISETESIKNDDIVFGISKQSTQKSIFRYNDKIDYTSYYLGKLYKILVYPEQFPIQYYNDMISNNIKNDDKFLIECETISNKFDDDGFISTITPYHIIKLNSESKVELFKI